MKKYAVVETVIRVNAEEGIAERVGKIIENPELAEKEPDNTIFVDSFEDVAKILSPAKLEIIQTLSRKPGMTVNELAGKLKRKQEAVSRDLRELKEDDIIETVKQGRSVHCTSKTDKISIALT